MDIKFIEAFLKIIEKGSFTKAADDLFITQSAISNRIHQLELELKTQLFERNHGKMIKLTAQGEKIYPILKSAFDLIDLIPNILHNSVHATRDISIVCPVHMADHIIPHLFEVLQNAYPNYNFSFNIGKSQTIIEEVQEGKVDVGFIYCETISKGKNYNVYRITNEPTLLVASPYHPKKDTILSLQDLKEEKMIIYHKSLLTYVILKKFFVDQGLTDLSIIEIQNFQLIKRMIHEDNCIAFLQSVVIQEDLDNHTLIQLSLNSIPPATPIYLIARHNVPSYVLSTILTTASVVFRSNFGQIKRG